MSCVRLFCTSAFVLIILLLADCPAGVNDLCVLLVGAVSDMHPDNQYSVHKMPEQVLDLYLS